MNKELQDLKARISFLSNEELLKMVNVDFSDYRDEAVSFAKEELKKRGLEKVTEEKIKELEERSIYKNREKKSGFNIISFSFSTKPNSVELGGWILIFLGGFNVILGFWDFRSWIGLLFLGLGLGAIRHYTFCVYIGTIIWGLGVIAFCINYFSKTKVTGYTDTGMDLVWLIPQSWFLWELIKSTPAYINLCKNKTDSILKPPFKNRQEYETWKAAKLKKSEKVSQEHPAKQPEFSLEISCPHCQEKISKDSIKCKYCAEDVRNYQKAETDNIAVALNQGNKAEQPIISSNASAGEKIDSLLDLSQPINDTKADLKNKLGRLDEIFKEGIISEQEYKTKKEKLLEEFLSN